MQDINKLTFRAQPGFDEAALRKGLPSAIPLKTIVIHCFDPRATEIPEVVAKHLGTEVYPGQLIHNEAGSRVGSTATLFPLTVAGGRAISALQSLSTMEFLFGIQNVVVVHHSFCGATAFTADSIIDAFKHDHGIDISHEYDRNSLAIENFETSLKYDVELIRKAPGVPKHINISGYFYNIDNGELIEVVKDNALQTV
jgi:carbonic anhydrase